MEKDPPSCPRCNKGDRVLTRKTSGSLSCGRCVHTWSSPAAYKQVKASERVQSTQEKLREWEASMARVSDRWHASGPQFDAKEEMRRVPGRKRPPEGGDSA